MSLKRNPLIFTPRPLAAGLGAVALTAGGLFMSPVVNPVAFAENTPISSPGQYQAAHTVSGQVFLDRSGRAVWPIASRPGRLITMLTLLCQE